jgi:hypothetical protein
MKESRKEFIKDLHSRSDIGWQKKIEREFSKLFKEDALVVGKWYHYNNWLIEYAGKGNFLTANYGFDKDGDYFYDNKCNGFGCTPREWTLATDKEVEEARIKEAKKRGYKYGCVIESKKHGHVTLNDRGFYTFHGELWLGDCVLTNNGVWAEIIKETITKEQAEKELGKTILN